MRQDCDSCDIFQDFVPAYDSVDEGVCVQNVQVCHKNNTTIPNRESVPTEILFNI